MAAGVTRRSSWLPERPSVGVQFALITAVLTVLIAAVSFALIFQRLRFEAAIQSEAAAHQTATRIAGTVQAVFDSALNLINITNDELVAQKEKGVTDPIVYDTILRHMIDAGTDRYGAWYVWNKGSSPWDQTVAQWSRQNGLLSTTYWHQNGMEMLRDRVPDEIFESALYKEPALHGLGVLLEPHRIAAENGDPTLVTSFSRPLGDANNAFGVIALDLKLDAVNDAVSAIELPAGAKLTIVSNRGIVAVSTSRSWAGSALESVSPLLNMRLDQAHKGDGFEFIVGDLPMLRTWNAIRFDGVGDSWYLFLDIPERSILAVLSDDKTLFVLVPAIALIALLGSILFAMERLVSRPLKRLSMIIVKLGEGHFEFKVPEQGRFDEVGDIARAIERLQQSGLEIDRLHTASGDEAYKREADRRRELDALSSHFSRSIAGLVAALGDVAATVDARSQEVAETIDDASMRVQALHAASITSKTSMGSVTSATSSLLSIIEAIGEQTRQSANVAVTVEKRTASTAASLTRLKTTIGKIDGVARTIGTVSRQINLIALNATIEAATAGEAGRGFDVVAQEMKTLALQTEQSTAEINAQIAAVAKASSIADDEITEMTESFVQMNAISGSIASALEMQVQTTGQIRGLIGDALERGDVLRDEMATLLRSSTRTKGAADVLCVQRDCLNEQIFRLKEEADGFLRILETA